MNKRKRKKRFKRLIENSFIGVDLGQNDDITHIMTKQEIYSYLSIPEIVKKTIEEKRKDTNKQYCRFVKAHSQVSR